MLRLVFVHGIGGQRRPGIEAQRWVSALAQGARKAGHSKASASLLDGSLADVVFADYSGLLQKPGGQGPGGLMVDDEESRILVDFLREVISARIAESVQCADAALLRARAQLQPAGAAQGAGDLLRRAVNSATTFLDAGPWRTGGQWASGKILVRDLAQVARYLARGEPDSENRTLDARIRNIVKEAFGAGPAIVIGHSLGSVVSFEALHEKNIGIPLWVTLGSPLAMRAVVWPRIMPRPPATPESVACWLNYWDRDDVIVARPILEDDFRRNAKGIRPESARVDADGLWVHTATKYLAHAEVAGPVMEAILSYGSPR
jgi:hypothetical protein